MGRKLLVITLLFAFAAGTTAGVYFFFFSQTKDTTVVTVKNTEVPAQATGMIDHSVTLVIPKEDFATKIFWDEKYNFKYKYPAGITPINKIAEGCDDVIDFYDDDIIRVYRERIYTIESPAYLTMCVQTGKQAPISESDWKRISDTKIKNEGFLPIKVGERDAIIGLSGDLTMLAIHSTTSMVIFYSGKHFGPIDLLDLIEKTFE